MPPVVKRRKKKGFFARLRSKYRLSLVDESSFEERLSFRLSRMNVILLFAGLFTLHGLLVAAVIVLLVNVLVDVAYARADARVSYG